MRTAQVTFVNSGHKAKLEEMVQTAAFEAGCQYALLALVEEAPEKFRDMSESWQTGVYIAGARKVLEILNNLHHVEKPIEKQKPRTLNSYI